MEASAPLSTRSVHIAGDSNAGTGAVMEVDPEIDMRTLARRVLVGAGGLFEQTIPVGFGDVVLYMSSDVSFGVVAVDPQTLQRVLVSM